MLTKKNLTLSTVEYNTHTHTHIYIYTARLCTYPSKSFSFWSYEWPYFDNKKVPCFLQ